MFLKIFPNLIWLETQKPRRFRPGEFRKQRRR